MTIRAKLVVLLIAFSFFVVGSAGSVAWAIWLYVDASFNQFASSSSLIDQADRLRAQLTVDVRRYFAPESSSDRIISPANLSLIDAIIPELNAIGGHEPLGDHLATLRDEVLAAARNRQSGSDSQAAVKQVTERIGHVIAAINGALSRQGSLAATSADRVQRNTLYILTGNLVAAVFLAAIGAAVVPRWIARPIVDLHTASERFADGDLAHRCPVRGRDELGKLAAQVNEMAYRLSESQRQLVDRERMAAVGELCSAVAHGIRNPLSAIASSAELILQQGRIDDPTKARVNDVLAESERLNQRVSRLLEFARTTRIVTHVLLVDDLLEQAADEMTPHLERKGFRLVRTLEEPKLRVRGDREMIINAVIELISNAADQDCRHKEIELSSGRGDGYALISVRDHGPGFKAPTLLRVFDLFFTTKASGTGIGLASVRKTAEMHDGRVKIDNAADGGAVVTLEIPEVHATPT